MCVRHELKATRRTITSCQSASKVNIVNPPYFCSFPPLSYLLDPFPGGPTILEQFSGRRYALRGLCRRAVSVCLCVSQHRVMYNNNNNNNKKYVLSNSESFQCDFFIFDHVTLIQLKICSCVQNFMKVAAGGVSIPAYWAPASLIRPTSKKTPIA